MFENNKVTTRIRTDFLSLTLHLSFYGLWMFFFISTKYDIHVSCDNKQFRVLSPAAPAAAVVPSCLRSEQLFPVTYKDKVKVQREPVAGGF